MYCQSNNDNIQDQGINLSEHLIELVKNKLGKYKSKNEYQLINKPNDYNGNNMIQSNTGSRKFQLVKGKYIYRTMPIKELNDLMGISTKNEKFYNINHDNANLNIINGHAGNLTQAVTYGGVLVRFAMKDEFINSVSNSIQVNGGEGTVDNEKVGLKGENEGMLIAYRNTPDKPRSFSFYINSSASKTFLENVENFEILQLGKGN